MLANNIHINRFGYGKVILIVLIISLLLITSTYFGTDSSGQKGDYQFAYDWGQFGKGEGQFYGPAGVATDRFGNVYVADSYNQRVQKFTSKGEFITMWGSEGTRRGEFRLPYGVAVDSKGDIFVTDNVNNNVQKFDRDGNMTLKWGTKPILRWRGGLGFSAEGYLAQLGFFNGPTGIAIDSRNNVYVMDTGNHRIQKFSNWGQFITAWGALGTKFGEFNTPTGIAIDREDNIYVVEQLNKRVQKFDSDGNFISSFMIVGTRGSGLLEPTDIAIDNLQYLYVLDRSIGLIQKFDNEGNLLDEIKVNSKSSERFMRTNGITIDPAGDIYVSDAANNNIQKFMKSLRMSDVQLFLNEVDLVLSNLFEVQSGRMILLPNSVHGVIVSSGMEMDVFGKTARISDSPSIPSGHTAKVVSFTIQNMDQRQEHMFRVQLGYLDQTGNFVAKHDSTVFLQKYKAAGDSMLVRIQPFFVPADQLSGIAKEPSHTPSNIVNRGTDIISRTATDGHNVPAEISLSVILDP